MMGKIMTLNCTALNIITISGNTSYKDYIYNMNPWPHLTGINEDFIYHFTYPGKGFAQLLPFVFLITALDCYNHTLELCDC